MADNKVYTLKEIADAEDMSYHTIYYWLKIGMLKPSGLVGKQKVFNDDEKKRFAKMVALRKEGYELAAIRKKINKD